MGGLGISPCTVTRLISLEAPAPCDIDEAEMLKAMTDPDAAFAHVPEAFPEDAATVVATLDVSERVVELLGVDTAVDDGDPDDQDPHGSPIFSHRPRGAERLAYSGRVSSTTWR